MTHDAMWFKLSVENSGIEKTNLINRAAAKSLGKIEVIRLLKLLEINQIENVDQLHDLILKGLEIVGEDYIKFTIKKVKENNLELQVSKCFAYEGVKKLGYIDHYECGIYDRLEGWFEGLRINYTNSSDFLGCLMHRDGTCTRNYFFKFGYYS